MLRIVLFFLILSLVSLFNTAEAQHHVFKVENLKSEDGLANVGIQHIMQDVKGFIWFGTSGGLHKYDGHKFTVYRHSLVDSSTISNNDILFIFEDSSHVMWIGTRDGLNRYDRDMGNFTTFRSGFGEKHLLSDKSIRCIYEDSQGYLWIAASEIGLLRFNKKTERFDKYYQHKPDNPTGLSTNYIKTIFETETGNLLLGSDNGLMLFNRHDETFTTYLPEKNANSLPNRYIKAVCVDKLGNLWIGTDNGLSYAIRKGDRILSFKNYYKSVSTPALGMSNNSVKSIIEDQHGNIWIASDEGVDIFNPAKQTFECMNPDKDQPFSLVNKNCRSLLEDRQGIIWIGTDAGVSKYDKGRFPFYIIRHNPNDANSLSSNFVTAVCEDHLGKLWIGTNGGLNSYDRKKDKYQIFMHEPGNESTITHNFISVITEDRDGFLWVGSHSGLNKLNVERKVIKRYLDESIVSMLITQDQTLLIGKWEGTFRYDSIHDSFVPYHPEIAQIRTQAIFEDSAGDLWLGTRTKLIQIVTGVDGKETAYSYQHSDDDPASISHNNITSFCESDDKGLWIGTAGGGLNYFDKKSKKFLHYTWDDGLSSDYINSIQAHKNILWLSTDNGLTKFDLVTRKFTTFDQSDGLPGNSFNQHASFKSNSNELYFGGTDGLSSFFPDSLKPSTHLPPVYLTEFQLFNKIVQPGRNKILPRSIENLTLLKLTNEEKVFTLGFVALNYRNPSKNRYAYKMENFDEDWIYTTSERRFATYSNLKSGEYTFRVKAANNDGLWNEKETQLKIIILPPFWETWWFYALCIAMVIGAVLLYNWLRLRNLKTIQARLVQEVTVRTNELTKEKERLEYAYEKITEHTEEIEAQKESIELDREKLEKAQEIIKEQNYQLLEANIGLEEKVKERTSELLTTVDELDFFVYRAAHDLRGPIARIEGLCHVGQMEPDSKEAYKYLKKLEEVCQVTNKMLSRLLRTRTINNREIKARTLSLNLTVSKIVKELSLTENITDITFKIEVDKDISFRADPELIDILLGNILQNAIRYQNVSVSDKYIKITGSRMDSSRILICIEDNGIGIPNNLRGNIFEMFFIGTEQSGGVGLGLYETKLIAKKLEGSVTLNPAKTETTEIQIILPIN